MAPFSDRATSGQISDTKSAQEATSGHLWVGVLRCLSSPQLLVGREHRDNAQKNERRERHVRTPAAPAGDVHRRVLLATAALARRGDGGPVVEVPRAPRRPPGV